MPPFSRFLSIAQIHFICLYYLCDFDSIMSAQCCQTALESAADGVEFPFSVVLVQLAYHNGCLNGEILSEVKMDQFFSGCIIHDTDKCVGYLSEILSSDI